jgi:hypothetical protein
MHMLKHIHDSNEFQGLHILNLTLKNCMHCAVKLREREKENIHWKEIIFHSLSNFCFFLNEFFYEDACMIRVSYTHIKC